LRIKSGGTPPHSQNVAAISTSNSACFSECGDCCAAFAAPFEKQKGFPRIRVAFILLA